MITEAQNKIIKEKTFQILETLKEKLENHYEDNLLSIFVTGSTAHSDFKTNQDVDLFVVVKEDIPGEKFEHIEQELKKAWNGQLKALSPIVSHEVEDIFHSTANTFKDENLEVIVAFAAGPYFPKPIKELNIHLHSVAPISRKFLEIWTNVFPFHALTMFHNALVLYGEDPKNIIEINADKKMLKIWLNALKNRLEKADDEIDIRAKTLIYSKVVLQTSMTVLAYVGIYVNNSEEVARKIKEEIKINSSNLPQKALSIKRNIDDFCKNEEDVKIFHQQSQDFIREIISYFE